jgi:hypothetical protein
VDPLGGAALHVPHHLRDRDVCLEAKEDVDVVRHAAQRQEPALLVADDPFHVGVQLGAQLWVNEPGTRLGAKDDVVQEPGEGSSHRCLPSGLSAEATGRGLGRILTWEGIKMNHASGGWVPPRRGGWGVGEAGNLALKRQAIQISPFQGGFG